jgi:uncharacterized protein
MERSTKLLLSVQWLAFLFVLLHWSQVVAQGQPNTYPLIIDMQLHALEVGGPAPGVCASNENVVWNGWDPRKPFTLEGSGLTCEGANFTAASTNEELMTRTLAALERYNVRAITSGRLELVNTWRTAAPDRIIPAASFSRPGRDPHGRSLYRPVSELRQLVAERKLVVFAEVAPQYDGMSPADRALEPYFALAEELDVPVGLHMGEGPVGGRHVEGYSAYRVKMGDPLLLEDLLVRHPKLRIYVMHYGSPFVDNMIALLYSYPQVYVDVAQNDWGFPRKHFHAQLRRLVEAGFGKRILFGSDQILWPDTIGLAIETIEAADFLTDEQKRDIFCRNAARFLRLDEKSCDR